MDGVIIDSNTFTSVWYWLTLESNTFHYNNWNGYFEKNFNITIPKKEFGLKLGESHKHFTKFFVNKYTKGKDYEEISQEIHERYKNMRKNIPLKKGIKGTLRKFREKNYKIALATGANKKDALHIIKRFDLQNYFDFIIGGDEVKRAKPDPEIFLKAAQGLNLNPEECVVIEDALMGLQAAKAAGIKCVMVEDEITKNQDHSMADGKIENLLELKKVLVGFWI